MSFKKKFKIKGLDRKLKYSTAAEIILDGKLREINKRVDKYFKNDSLENLHVMRIAFRRFRYVLELFYDCVEPKLFKKVYILTKNIQDLLGEVRDLDVLEQKMKLTETEVNQRLPDFFFEKIHNERNDISNKIKMELINFISDNDINKFLIN